MLALLSHGGHNAFLTGLVPSGKSYDVDVFSQFVSAMFSNDEVSGLCNGKPIEVNSNCL